MMNLQQVTIGAGVTQMKRLLIVLLLCASGFAQSMAGSNCPIVGQRAAINATSSGDNTIITANPSKRIFVWQMFFVNSHATTDVNVTLKEGSTSISGAFVVKAAGGAATFDCTGLPWAIVPTGSTFIINESAASSLQGTAYFTYED